MTGIRPDRDVIDDFERAGRWRVFLLNVLGAVLVSAAFVAVMYALDISLTNIGKRQVDIRSAGATLGER